jgi:adenosylcobinamide-GDP ribazoletransferase
MGPITFPLAGLILGFVLLVVNRLIEPYLPSEILALVLLAINILSTGGRHLAATQETFDRLSRTSAPVNTASHRPIHGLVAVLLVVLFKLRSIEVIAESRGLSLLLTPLLARWSLLLFIFGSSSAAANGARRLTDNMRPWHLIVATVMTVGFALFLATSQALWVALCLSLLALFARSYLYRREGGISLASCGALIELTEAVSFTLFASL